MKLGNVADGDHFHGREQEFADFWRLLSTENIVFSGPRRLGKSSLLRRLCSTAGERGMHAMHLDVGGCGGIRGFLEALNKIFPERITEKSLRNLGNVLKTYAESQATLKLGDPGGKAIKQITQTQSIEPWRQLAESLQQRISHLPLIIMLDEFSVFLDKALKAEPDEIVNLLDWLRAWRQSDGVKCRFIFTGSISLNSVLESNGLDTQFNDCYDYRLNAFRVEEAKVLLVKEAARLDWQLNDEILQYLCDRVSWLSPFFLNLLLDESVRAGAARLEDTGAQTRTLKQIDIDLGYELLVSSGSRFTHWYQRLRTYLDADEVDMSMAVLAAIARSRTGKLTRSSLRARLHKLDTDPTRRSQRLDAVLMQLSEDGYLTQSEDGVQFLNPLLRDYWKRNHA